MDNVKCESAVCSHWLKVLVFLCVILIYLRRYQITRATWPEISNWFAPFGMLIRKCLHPATVLLSFVLLFLFHSSSVLADLAVWPIRTENWGQKEKTAVEYELNSEYIRLLIKLSVFSLQKSTISEVVTAETVKITVFLEVTPCRLVYYRCANIPIYMAQTAKGLNFPIQQESGTNL